KDKEWLTVEKDGRIGKVPKGTLIQKENKISSINLNLSKQTSQEAIIQISSKLLLELENESNDKDLEESQLYATEATFELLKISTYLKKTFAILRNNIASNLEKRYNLPIKSMIIQVLPIIIQRQYRVEETVKREAFGALLHLIGPLNKAVLWPLNPNEIIDLDLKDDELTEEEEDSIVKSDDLDGNKQRLNTVADLLIEIAAGCPSANNDDEDNNDEEEDLKENNDEDETNDSEEKQTSKFNIIKQMSQSYSCCALSEEVNDDDQNWLPAFQTFGQTLASILHETHEILSIQQLNINHVIAEEENEIIKKIDQIQIKSDSTQIKTPLASFPKSQSQSYYKRLRTIEQITKTALRALPLAISMFSHSMIEEVGFEYSAIGALSTAVQLCSTILNYADQSINNFNSMKSKPQYQQNVNIDSSSLIKNKEIIFHTLKLIKQSLEQKLIFFIEPIVPFLHFIGFGGQTSEWINLRVKVEGDLNDNEDEQQQNEQDGITSEEIKQFCGINEEEQDKQKEWLREIIADKKVFDQIIEKEKDMIDNIIELNQKWKLSTTQKSAYYIVDQRSREKKKIYQLPSLQIAHPVLQQTAKINAGRVAQEYAFSQLKDENDQIKNNFSNFLKQTVDSVIKSTDFTYQQNQTSAQIESNLNQTNSSTVSIGLDECIQLLVIHGSIEALKQIRIAHRLRHFLNDTVKQNTDKDTNKETDKLNEKEQKIQGKSKQEEIDIFWLLSQDTLIKLFISLVDKLRIILNSLPIFQTTAASKNINHQHVAPVNTNAIAGGQSLQQSSTSNTSSSSSSSAQSSVQLVLPENIAQSPTNLSSFQFWYPYLVSSLIRSISTLLVVPSSDHKQKQQQQSSNQLPSLPLPFILAQFEDSEINKNVYDSIKVIIAALKQTHFRSLQGENPASQLSLALFQFLLTQKQDVSVSDAQFEEAKQEKNNLDEKDNVVPEQSENKHDHIHHHVHHHKHAHTHQHHHYELNMNNFSSERTTSITNPLIQPSFTPHSVYSDALQCLSDFLADENVQIEPKNQVKNRLLQVNVVHLKQNADCFGHISLPKYTPSDEGKSNDTFSANA
ncbi:MAG: hypothetical protein EZS28_024828, partial [Streblomastix strix]